MDFGEQASALLAALATGLLIGIERGWQLRNAPDGSRVAGVRTFTLIGLVSGIAGLLSLAGFALPGGALMLAAGVIVAAGYIDALRLEGRRDATSAIAAVAVLGLGFLAGAVSPGLALAAAAVVTLMLAFRTEAHRLIDRLGEDDIKALARFSVIAAAVLPFLPSGDVGPYGAWNLQKLWLVVILVTGFSFAGYVANRIFGARHGTIATAIIGGAYSSTAVTQTLAQRLGSGQSGGAEQAGIALASMIMYLRVLLLVAVLATSVLPAFAMVVLPALAASAVGSWLLYRRAPNNGDAAPTGNPIALLPALGFVLFLAIAAVAASWAEARFGQQGIALTILLLGSLDVDAAIVTVGGLKPGLIGTNLAALAIGGTILANMAVKLGITLAYARRAGATAAIALGASMAVLAASLAMQWLWLSG